MRERRRYVRVLANLTLRVKEEEPAKDKNDKPQKPAKSKDVGGGGIRFVSSHKLAIGTRLKMEIDVPGARHSVVAHATVIWSKKIDEAFWEVATEFVDIEPRDRDKIMRHVYFARKD